MHKAFLVTVAFSLLLSVSFVSAHNIVVVVPLGEDDPPEVRAGSQLLTNSIGMEFSLIPSGSFVMGSPNGTGSSTSRPVNIEEGGRDSDEGQHYVTISNAYYMQTTEVTQSQYQAVMGSNPSHFSEIGSGGDCGPNCPVEMLSWNDVQNFIDALNTRESRGSCNTQPNRCYALPTESQWEFAARGVTVSAFYNGDITNTGAGFDPNLERIGWYSHNSATTTNRVAIKAANHWGLYDMSGNVWEYCQDKYGSYPDGPLIDPTGPVIGSNRVIRGGSWNTSASNTRSAIRGRISPDVRRFDIGFRLVLPKNM